MVSPISVGSIVEGTVTGITRFGAFVLLPNGQTGLVHISEVANAYVREVSDHVKEQQVVRVKVLSAEPGGKVALSIKQAEPDFRPAPPRSRDRRGPVSFEDRLARFLKDSEDRQGDLRRVESKRGGRGGGREYGS
ncbi:MAG TPA: S1 RNA-binding domain-containing protein [Symbiobacteriaceae bacterium]|nr:S1 RNA-binding domain-containing protein [Symbiobacteriaceae bacterium]